MTMPTMDYPHPLSTHPGSEHLARIAHARQGAVMAHRGDPGWLPWESLTAVQREDLIEEVSAIVESMCIIMNSPGGPGHPLNVAVVIGSPIVSMVDLHEATAMELQV